MTSVVLFRPDAGSSRVARSAGTTEHNAPTSRAASPIENSEDPASRRRASSTIVSSPVRHQRDAASPRPTTRAASRRPPRSASRPAIRSAAAERAGRGRRRSPAARRFRGAARPPRASSRFAALAHATVSSSPTSPSSSHSGSAKRLRTREKPAAPGSSDVVRPRIQRAPIRRHAFVGPWLRAPPARSSASAAFASRERHAVAQPRQSDEPSSTTADCSVAGAARCSSAES